MSADARSDVQALDATPGSGGRGRSLMRATLSLFLGLAMLAALAPLASALPPGRGYEKLSPADKDGQDILQGFDKAAVSGNAASYVSFGAFGDSEGGGLITQFVSTRGATDWLTESVSPALVTSAGLDASLFNELSDDLDTTIFSYAAGDPAFDGNTPGTANLYRRNPDGTIDTLSFGQPTPPPGTQTPTAPTYGGRLRRPLGRGLQLLRRSADARHRGPRRRRRSSTTRTPARATATSSSSPCSRTAPRPRRAGRSAAPNFTPGFNTVSDDGSRIFWTLRRRRGLRADRPRLDRARLRVAARRPRPERRAAEGVPVRDARRPLRLLHQRREADQQLAGRAEGSPTSTATTSTAGTSST